MATYQKPLPIVNEESRPFWEACKRHELVLQKCKDCGEIRFYPRALCGNCLSTSTEWIRASGKGTVYSFTVTYQNRGAGFRDELPYVLAYVELEEGIRMLTNIVGCDPESVYIGMPVMVTFDEVTEAITLPKFTPRQ